MIATVNTEEDVIKFFREHGATGTDLPIPALPCELHATSFIDERGKWVSSAFAWRPTPTSPWNTFTSEVEPAAFPQHPVHRMSTQRLRQERNAIRNCGLPPMRMSQYLDMRWHAIEKELLFRESPKLIHRLQRWWVKMGLRSEHRQHAKFWLDAKVEQKALIEEFMEENATHFLTRFDEAID